MSNRAQGNLPSTTKVNLKEHCKAITLSSGTSYQGLSGKQFVKAEDKDQQALAQAQAESLPEKEKSIEGLQEKDASLPVVKFDHHIKIPYPQRLRKNNMNKTFPKFLEVFKKLHNNIPFAEALKQMLSYLMFMKEILSKKRMLGDYETVPLTEECSAVFHYTVHHR